MACALQLMCRSAPSFCKPHEAVCVCEIALPLLWTFPPFPRSLRDRTCLRIGPLILFST